MVPRRAVSRSMRHPKAIVLVGTVIALTLSACSSSSGGNSTATSATGQTGGSGSSSATSDQVKASVTFVGGFNPPGIQNIATFATSKTVAPNEYFAKNGLTVKAQQSGGSPLSVAAILSGKAQFASIATSTLLAAAASGTPIEAVFLENTNFPFEILAKKDLSTAQDLNGKPMVMNSNGSTDQLIAEAYFKSRGLDVSPSWVPGHGVATQEQYMLSGKIVAGTFDIGGALRLLKADPDLQVLVSANDIQDAVPLTGTVIAVTKSYASSHPKVVAEFVQGYMEKSREIYEQESVFGKMINTLFPSTYSSSDIATLQKAYVPTLGINGGMNYSVLNDTLATFKKYFNKDPKTNDKIPDLKSVFDDKFAGMALDKIGVVPDPQDPASWYKKSSN